MVVRPDPVTPDTARWNHNLHYHPWLLRALPTQGDRILDFGCGEGILARRLRARGARVTAIDTDRSSIDLALDQGADGIDYLCGDAMTWPFEEGSFDAVVAVAVLHHTGTEAGLQRMAALLRPGGVLLVVGLARSGRADLPRDAAGFVASRLRFLRGRPWSSPAPTVWPPADSWAQVRSAATRVLPGVEYRRRLLWRYTLRWTKPM
jgi:SAM-dependent methyltransferase